MNEKIFQGIIYVLLILMLMMCGIFFWGAYYNHYVTLNKIGNKSISILNKVTENDVEAVESRIERLKNIQKNLFDTNTISFFYNLFMIIIVTIGGYILSTIKSSERKAQIELLNLRRNYCAFHDNFHFGSRFQYSLGLLHEICSNVFMCNDKGKRNDFLVEMRDVLTEINRDCSSITITEIAIRDQDCGLFIDMLGKVERRLIDTGINDEFIMDGTKEIWTFLQNNRDRFAARWQYLMDKLVIKSIEI